MNGRGLAAGLALAFAACTYDFDEAYSRCHETGWCAASYDGGIALLAAPSVAGDTRVGGTLTLDPGGWDAGAGVAVTVTVELQRCAGWDASVCAAVAAGDGGYLIRPADLDGRFRAVATARAGAASASAESPLTPYVSRTAAASLVTLTGFETGDEHSVTRPRSVLSVTQGGARTGRYMLRLQGAGSGAQLEEPKLQQTTDIVGRFAIALDALPDTGELIHVAELQSGLVTDPLFAIDDQGRLLAGDGPVASRAQGPALALGRWYVVDFHLHAPDGGREHSLDWRVHGVEQPTGAVIRPDTRPDGGPLGPVTAINLGEVQDTPFSAFIDDFALSIDALDYPIGDGRVVALGPASLARVSKDAGFSCYDPSGPCGTGVPVSSGTPGVARAIGQRPFDPTAQVTQILDGPQELLGFTLEPPPSASGLVSAVSLVAGLSSLAPTTVGLKLHSADGGAYHQSFTSVNGPAKVDLVMQPKKGGAAYTLGDLTGNEVSFGYCGNATAARPQLHDLLLEVDVAAGDTR